MASDMARAIVTKAHSYDGAIVKQCYMQLSAFGSANNVVSENVVGLYTGISGTIEVFFSFDQSKVPRMSSEPFKLTPDSVALFLEMIVSSLKGWPVGRRAANLPDFIITETLFSLCDSSENVIFSRRYSSQQLGHMGASVPTLLNSFLLNDLPRWIKAQSGIGGISASSLRPTDRRGSHGTQI